ncbi:hypothetical protein [Endozoicomonas atrinae]|uniref:hypothetical protein n=1 Tax=Endozoicomonas atrinae TaxID=1333660 RepID=UPI0008243244|nr:hypothetical protein [Endozoicomonas atrinae]
MKVRCYSTTDDLVHDITIDGEGRSSNILKVEFKQVPFVDKAFINRILDALMHEVREQFMAWNADNEFGRNPTYFDRKKAERTAIKIIEDMKRGSNGL